MRKYLIGAAAAAGLVGGSIAVAAISPLGSAAARPTTVQVGQQTDPTTPGSTAPGRQGKARPEPGARIDEALQPLVDNGTISTEQRDAVRQALLDKMGSRGSSGGGRGGHRGGAFGQLKGVLDDGLETVATSLGMPKDELVAQLKQGQSIADIARARNIDPAKVVGDLVAAATAKIDEAVAAGKIPADKADMLKSRLPEMMQAMVDGKGFGHGGFKGPKGDDGDDEPATPPSTEAPAPAPAPTPAPTTAAPTSTAPPATPAPPTTAAGAWTTPG